MRHIPGDRFRPSPDWLRRAAEAQAAVAAIAGSLAGSTQEERKTTLIRIHREITRHADLWNEIKPALEELSRGKCWYCESKEHRSHFAVDHFRPKSGVAECADHPGYWWLAFVHQNYRFACTYCNSLLRSRPKGEVLGKGIHFPLMNEANRLYHPQDPNDESPCLLDPMVPADPPLLGFMDDGQATSKYSIEKSPLFFRRADSSIRTYNLNQAKIADGRSLIAFEIKHQVRRGEKYLDDAFGGAPSAVEHFAEVYRVLLGLIAPEAPYSAAARAFLAGYRDKDWVVQALMTA